MTAARTEPYRPAPVEPPNLDGMSPEELRAYTLLIVRTPAVVGLPISVLEYLVTYASQKAAAMELRALGRIAAAQFHEQVAEAAYRCLPEHLRW